jgi:hypothetical protein
MNLESKMNPEEFKILSNLELETTKLSNTSFSAFLSLSFLMPGIVLTTLKDQNLALVHDLGLNISLPKLVFLLGFVFYLFAIFHYIWFHRYSHIYRDRLIFPEKEIGDDFRIYQLRLPPNIFNREMHFEWAIYLLVLFI